MNSLSKAGRARDKFYQRVVLLFEGSRHESQRELVMLCKQTKSLGHAERLSQSNSGHIQRRDLRCSRNERAVLVQRQRNRKFCVNHRNGCENIAFKFNHIKSMRFFRKSFTPSNRSAAFFFTTWSKSLRNSVRTLSLSPVLSFYLLFISTLGLKGPSRGAMYTAAPEYISTVSSVQVRNNNYN